jgi:branched-chain amino acid transport system permease protein
MNLFLQLMLSGIMQGGIYGLIAVGIVLIYKSTRIFNFAHGELAALGAFLIWCMLVQMNFSLPLAIVCAVAAALLLSSAIERLALRPMIGQPLFSIIMMTIGLGQVLAGIITLLWPGPGRKYPPIIPSGIIKFGGITISAESAFSFIISMAAFLAFAIFFQRTKTGLAMRGTAEDPQLAQSGGIRVTTIFSISWFIAIMMATIGGVLLANLYTVDRNAVSAFVLKSFAVIIMGGLESISGAIIAGIMLGVLEMLGAGYLDPFVGAGFSQIIPFIFMLLILIVRPFGLFGYKKIERV